MLFFFQVLVKLHVSTYQTYAYRLRNMNLKTVINIDEPILQRIVRNVLDFSVEIQEDIEKKWIRDI